MRLEQAENCHWPRGAACSWDGRVYHVRVSTVPDRVTPDIVGVYPPDERTLDEYEDWKRAR